MKSKKCIVPRSLVVAHMPHPEPYGESIVVLKNNMTTDVYTDDQGRLFTETNNLKLIKYLQNFDLGDPKICLSTQEIELKTMSHEDVILLYKWLKLKPNDLSLEEVQEYRSHAIYHTSHLFMIAVNQENIGYVGYSIISDSAIITLNIILRTYLTKQSFHQMLTLVTDHVIDKHQTNIFLISVPKKDDELIKYLIHEGFDIDRIIYFHHQKEVLLTLKK